MPPPTKYIGFHIHNKHICAGKLPGIDLPKSFPALWNSYIIAYGKEEPPDSADHMHLNLPVRKTCLMLRKRLERVFCACSMR